MGHLGGRRGGGRMHVNEAEELLRRERWPSVRDKLHVVCTKLQSFCTAGHSYSLNNLIRALNSSQLTIETVLPLLNQTYQFAASHARWIDFTSEFTPTAERVEAVFFTPLQLMIGDLRESLIERVVHVIRGQGHADAAVLDSYTEFRRHGTITFKCSLSALR